MLKQPPSIFNDVIGPVMKGPSSSHTAGPTRIGKLAGQLLQGELKKVRVEFSATGSFAMTYRGQGTDRGLVGGLLGWDPEDERISTSLEEAAARGIEVEFNVTDFKADHPNTAKITLAGEGEEVKLTALSVGGGMIEIIEIDGFPLSISGDFYEILLFLHQDCKEEAAALMEEYRALAGEGGFSHYFAAKGRGLVNIKMATPLSPETLEKAAKRDGVARALMLTPVLPVLSRKNCTVPFATALEMQAFAQREGLDLWEAALRYEMERGRWTEDKVFEKMGEIIGFMEASVKEGLENRTRQGKILKPQAGIFQEAAREGKLIGTGVMNTAMAWSMAVLEVNSYLGVVVAAPTAGSCGVLPGAVLGSAAEMQASREEQVKAMLAAGGIGLLIAKQATFAAEVCGCQAECGAGSAMAAAGLVQLAGGTLEEGVAAASIALQNLLGMICDPVAELVEVPCLGKNVVAVANALSSANMALAGVDPVIPLDEVIQAMYQVGTMLPRELRCTGLGGVAVTGTGRAIKKRLDTSR